MGYFRVETDTEERLLFHRALIPAPRRVVLRGRIVTMNSKGDVLQDGMLCIEGDRIAQVGPWPDTLPPPFDKAPILDTGGTLYPGLIELHNHPAYNVVPMWDVPQHFDNRSQWRANANYKRRVSNPGTLLTSHPNDKYPKALVRFVECKALLGGVTTTQGFVYKNGDKVSSYFEGLVRNVEFPKKPWPVASDYINDLDTKDKAAEKLLPILGKQQPFIIHLSEGIDTPTRDFFYNLQQADSSWLIGQELITIHATALDAAEFGVLAQQGGGGIVWSPLSNFLLYGDTTKVGVAKKQGAKIAIGSDWAPSGTKNLLGEIKIAKLVSTHGGDIFSDQELVEAITSVPAKMMGWSTFVGSIEVNKTADVIIVDNIHADPYTNLIAADESNMIAVIIDGRPRAGRASIVDPRVPGVELLHIAKQDMVLDIVDAADHPLAGVSLSSAIATNTDALARLPDIADEAHRMAPLMKGAFDQWRPIPDYDDEAAAADLFVAAALPGRNDVDPMTIEPLTAVDDGGFITRVKSNANVPKWLKDAL